MKDSELAVVVRGLGDAMRDAGFNTEMCPDCGSLLAMTRDVKLQVALTSSITPKAYVRIKVLGDDDDMRYFFGTRNQLLLGLCRAYERCMNSLDRHEETDMIANTDFLMSLDTYVRKVW